MIAPLISAYFWLTACIYHEARGEPLAGQVAVGHVVLNRAAQRHQSIYAVISARNQFSWFAEKRSNAFDFHDDKALKKCAISALTALLLQASGQKLEGANMYYNPSRASPRWAKSKNVELIQEIGHHRFMKEENHEY